MVKIVKIIDCAFSPRLDKLPTRGKMQQVIDFWIDQLNSQALIDKDFIKAMKYYPSNLQQGSKSIFHSLLGGDYLQRELVILKRHETDYPFEYDFQNCRYYPDLLKTIYLKFPNEIPTEGLYSDVIRAWRDYNNMDTLSPEELKSLCKPMDSVYNVNVFESFIKGEYDKDGRRIPHVFHLYLPKTEPVDYNELTLPPLETTSQPMQPKLPLNTSHKLSEVPSISEENFENLERLVTKLNILIQQKKSLYQEIRQKNERMGQISQILSEVEKSLSSQL